MNPVDHPMGGGEGNLQEDILVLEMEFLQKDYRTRSKTKASNKYIVERRKK